MISRRFPIAISCVSAAALLAACGSSGGLRVAASPGSSFIPGGAAGDSASGGASGGGSGSAAGGSGAGAAGSGSAGSGGSAAGGSGSGSGSAGGSGGSGSAGGATGGGAASAGLLGGAEKIAGRTIYTTGNVVLGAGAATPGTAGDSLVRGVGTTIASAGSNLANNGLASAVSGTPVAGPLVDSLAKVTVLDSGVGSGASPLIGASVLSPTQAQGQIASAGVASAGNLASVQVPGGASQGALAPVIGGATETAGALSGIGKAVTNLTGGAVQANIGTAGNVASVTVPTTAASPIAGVTGAVSNTVQNVTSGQGGLLGGVTGSVGLGAGAGVQTPAGSTGGGLLGGVKLGR